MKVKRKQASSIMSSGLYIQLAAKITMKCEVSMTGTSSLEDFCWYREGVGVYTER
jgi:hypothetical protein